MHIKCSLLECLFYMLCAVAVLFLTSSLPCDGEPLFNGGWEVDTNESLSSNSLCNIDKHEAGTLTQEEFIKRYAFSEPVIITDFDNSDFRELCAKETLLSRYGNFEVQLSTANTYSYKKITVTFREYLEKYLQPQSLHRLGNETYYLFGDIDRVAWDTLLRHYLRPPWKVPQHRGELSFGIAGAGTGVPFHFHGPGFGEVIYGKKRWFLYPPSSKPIFDPDKSTLDWYFHDYPRLTRDEKPLECIMKPGEVIYFPDRWWHATLNVETSVFVSTFLSP